MNRLSTQYLKTSGMSTNEMMQASCRSRGNSMDDHMALAYLLRLQSRFI
jgi:hypothetical protein